LLMVLTSSAGTRPSLESPVAVPPASAVFPVAWPGAAESAVVRRPDAEAGDDGSRAAFVDATPAGQAGSDPPFGHQPLRNEANSGL
jgi:hypothetical protein